MSLFLPLTSTMIACGMSFRGKRFLRVLQFPVSTKLTLGPVLLFEVWLVVTSVKYYRDVYRFLYHLTSG